MSKIVLVILTTIGEDATLFNLYSNSDGCSVPIVTDVTDDELLNGYLLTVPDNATIICVEAANPGICENRISLNIDGAAPTPSLTPGLSPTPTPTPTPTPIICETPSIIDIIQVDGESVSIKYITRYNCSGATITWSRDLENWTGSSNVVCCEEIPLIKPNDVVINIGDTTGLWFFMIRQLCTSGNYSDWSVPRSFSGISPTLIYYSIKSCEVDECVKSNGSISVDGELMYGWSAGMPVPGYPQTGTIPVVNGSFVEIVGTIQQHPQHCETNISRLTISVSSTDPIVDNYSNWVTYPDGGTIIHSFYVSFGETNINIDQSCY